jgi:hypothetical protein
MGREGRSGTDLHQPIVGWGAERSLAQIQSPRLKKERFREGAGEEHSLGKSQQLPRCGLMRDRVLLGQGDAQGAEGIALSLDPCRAGRRVGQPRDRSSAYDFVFRG